MPMSKVEATNGAAALTSAFLIILETFSVR
jgi:hypothetical protein